MLGPNGRSWSELADRLHALEAVASDESTGAVVVGAQALAHELRAQQMELERQNLQLRATQQALEASRERFALLYDFAPVGYVTLDARGNVEEMNLTAAGMLQGDRDVMLQRSFAEVAGIEDRSALVSHLARCLREGQSRTTELRARPAGAPAIVLQLTSTPVSRTDGRNFSLTALADITESRRVELERQALLEHAREVAESANRMKDDFLGVVSHELRTPLTAVLGWAHVLTEHPSPAPALVDRGLRVMRRNAEALARIVDDILDVSRIVTGKLRVDLHEVDLEPVVQGVVDGLRPTAEAKGLSLTMLTEAPCWVQGDAERLQQVVWNLVSNAIKFTPSGGSVHVMLSGGTRHGPEVVKLSVRDTGRGIEARELPHIFDRFRQVDSSTTRAHSGLGLGLAIVKHIVEAHGGQALAESAGAHRGALFVVEIPRANRPSTLPPPRLRESGFPPPGETHTESAEMLAAGVAGSACLLNLRVLVVDDEPDTLDLTSLALAQRGAEVKTARSAGEALSVLASFGADAMVCDIAMPDIDGYDLLRRVRSLVAPFAAIPAIALSGHARPEDADRALRAGFQRHVAKPVDTDVLVGMLQELASTVGR
jgi:PAS domain S-box-containing protein